MQAILPLRLAAKCLSELEALGFELDVFSDIEGVAEFIGGVGKDGVTPKMDPMRNDFSTDNCCWFSLKVNGEQYAVIGSRSEEVGPAGLSQYLSRSTNRHYRENGKVAVSSVASTSALAIFGKAAYVGELHVHEGKRGRRDVLRLFVIFTISMVTAEWGVDNVYAFFRERDVLARMPQHYGFTDCVPGVMRWDADVDGRGSSEWLASISRSRVEHLASLCLSDSYWLTLQSKGSE